MRTFLLFIFLLICSFIGSGQLLTANEFVSIPGMSQKKIGGYLARIGLRKGETIAVSDTVMQSYYVRNNKSKSLDFADLRLVQTWYTKHKSGFVYYTSSQKECVSIIKSLKGRGFFCETENIQAPFIYQKDDLMVELSSRREDTLSVFKFFVTKEVLPRPSTIRFAEDFLLFNSHENLVYIFGRGNVQKDIYYFSDSNMVRSSVLFPNTNRQIIFVWQDEINRCTVSHLLVGNSLRANSTIKYNQQVQENLWTMRNGLRANMTLVELVKINKSGISFYGWNSQFPGIVEPSKKGEIDFSKTGVVLSCLNCAGSDFLNRDIINSDDVFKNSLRLFVLALIVIPQPGGTETASLK
jgi:hypothetical protein